MIAFTGRAYVAAAVQDSWVRARNRTDDLSAPLNPPFLGALESRFGRPVNNVDLVLLGHPVAGPPPVDVTILTGSDHPRVGRAHRYRADVRVYGTPGPCSSWAGDWRERWEMAVEVDEDRRGVGLGRRLAAAARHLVPERPPRVGAQVAPGNAVSVRAFLAAGFHPVGAEALLARTGIEPGTRRAVPRVRQGSEPVPSNSCVSPSAS